MKKRIAAMVLAAAFTLLTGCRPSVSGGVAGHLVTQITVTCETCTDFTRRYYNTAEKMQRILLYIRSIGPMFTPDADPEALAGRIICITMTCADNSQKIYRQKDTLYFQEGTGPWKQIDPEHGIQLWRILFETPSDPEKTRFLPDSLPRLPGNWIYSPALRRFHADWNQSACSKTKNRP